MLCRLSASQPACLPAPDPAPKSPFPSLPFTTVNRLTAHTMRRTNIVSHLLGTRTRARAKARAVAIYFCRLCVYNKSSSVSQLRCDCGRGSRANERTTERANVVPTKRAPAHCIYAFMRACVWISVRGYEVYVYTVRAAWKRCYVLNQHFVYTVVA